MSWESVIGLEVHIQLQTASKIFSGASTTYGAAANSQACGFDIALPGVLPVLNEKAVMHALKFGLAINAQIASQSIFARKNYFYPDLPKGYQISQYENPIVGNGTLSIQLENNQTKIIGIERAHLEEDAGKSLHGILSGKSGIDLNRAGTPLLEVVSKPELSNALEAVAYLKTLHRLVRYLEICDGNMQEGSFRCDANVSVRRRGDSKLGTRTEIKNINSFRFVELAINFEIARQIDVIENGGNIIQETRLYDSIKNETRSMRSKETAHDYRYFPDPDLLPVVITAEMLKLAKKDLPELPEAKLARYQTMYQLSAYDAGSLIHEPTMAAYYEVLVKKVSPKLAANWLLGDFSAQLNKNNLSIADCPVNSSDLSLLLQRIEDQTISSSAAKTVFLTMWESGDNADQIIARSGLQQISDTTLITEAIDEIIAANPEQVAQYRSGKEKVFSFFVGHVMKKLSGKANPQHVNTLLQEKLRRD